ncbi:hypothetical protein I7I53_09048 [Histoplasma capsulatum var. duboisii H88]|uniref:Uncharacterized protein n=1 Tax=Ajellomyces capsulatus (strain H88) TaxID=544711 RepID=A0A8A1L5F5_AJEC8|nr:hypothetical protein I7I53_09048 [Histoplasma capsulatum var. duboisii H88]
MLNLPRPGSLALAETQTFTLLSSNTHQKPPAGCICDSLGITPTSEQAPVPFLSYLQGCDLRAKLETNRHGDEYLHTTP